MNERFDHKAVSQAATAGVLLDGQAGKVIEVWEILLYNAVEQDIQVFDGLRSLTGPLTAFAAKGGFFLPYTGSPHWESNPGGSLRLTTSGGTQVSGFILYRFRD